MFEVVQGSARVHNIKKRRKTRGEAIIREGGGGGGGGAYNRMIFFLFPSRWAYKQSEGCNQNFTV